MEIRDKITGPLWLSISRALGPSLCLLCRGRVGPVCQADSRPRAASSLVCCDCHGDFEQNLSGCYCCAEPLRGASDVSGSFLCGRCQKIPPAFQRVYAPYLYSYPLSELIQRFKGKDHLLLNRLLTDLISDYLRVQFAADNAKKPDLILPVPTHWRTRLRRGFNPAARLADGIGRRLKIPVKMDVLCKQTFTRPQHDLNRAQRLKNLKHSFGLRHPEKIAGRSVALVDDVVTTGTTADVIAALLRDNGACSVQVWAVARTPFRH